MRPRRRFRTSPTRRTGIGVRITARPIVVYDANVLYPAQLRDLLMRLAVAGLVHAHWSDKIHEEWMENVLSNRPDLQQEQLERTRASMERVLLSARVEDYEQHIASISLHRRRSTWSNSIGV